MSRSVTPAAQPRWLLLVLLLAASLLGACGGSSSTPEPSITTQPVDASVVAGDVATFSVAAAGTGLGYEWQGSGDGVVWTPIAGAAASSFSTPPTNVNDDGRRFRVVVSSAGISVVSSAVRLTVTGSVVAPAITVQPAAQSVVAPDPGRFVVTASGTAPAYRWQRSGDGGATWADIAGAAAATHDTGATSTAMNDQRYRVVVANAAGSVTSAPAVLTVAPTPTLPTFTAQPTSQSIGIGAAAAFTVAATGTPAPTLQWQRSSDGGVTWTAIAAATDATYNTGPATVAQNGEQYRAVATNAAGSAPSSAATLTVAVAAAPAITGQPADATVLAGRSASFAVGTSGTPTPTLQWQLSTDNGASWANVNGATGSTLTLAAGLQISDSGRQFRALASNASGNATSRAALLTVIPSSFGTFQFNLFAFNSGPAAFLLYGGSVKDAAGTIQCSGNAGLSDPCPKWRGDFLNGTTLTLTATPWPGFRVGRWVGGDCGSPGTAPTVTLVLNHNSNCFPEFEVIPGATFALSTAAAGPWVGLVVQVVVDRFGNLVVPDDPSISCGPLAATQRCIVNLDVPASSYTVTRLKAVRLTGAPAGGLRWTCSSLSPEDGSAVVRTVFGEDVALGPIHSNTACSAELVPS